MFNQSAILFASGLGVLIAFGGAVFLSAVVANVAIRGAEDMSRADRDLPGKSRGPAGTQPVQPGTIHIRRSPQACCQGQRTSENTIL